MSQVRHDETQALFNAGIAKLYRIDIQKKKIHMARETSNFKSWYYALSGWREEMIERMTKEEEVQADGFESTAMELMNSKYNEIAERKLQKYGVFLSKIEYKYGYSMPDKEQAGSALM